MFPNLCAIYLLLLFFSFFTFIILLNQPLFPSSLYYVLPKVSFMSYFYEKLLIVFAKKVLIWIICDSESKNFYNIFLKHSAWERNFRYKLKFYTICVFYKSGQHNMRRAFINTNLKMMLMKKICITKKIMIFIMFSLK